VPLAIFVNDKGFAKIEIGLGRGKKLHDKRETIKNRDLDRDLKRFI
jgi:SsrA-binding protein